MTKTKTPVSQPRMVKHPSALIDTLHRLQRDLQGIERLQQLQWQLLREVVHDIDQLMPGESAPRSV